MKFENDQFHVRSPEEMYAALPGHEEALGHSVRIAETWSRTITRASTSASASSPRSSRPGSKTPEAYLRELCEAGLQQRYDMAPSPSRAADRPDGPRAGIIERMGFASYFLIVWDFVRYAREQEIPNTARGGRPAGPWSATSSTSATSTR